MIDAMCHSCRFLSKNLLGWKCFKDAQGIEHDPTDQACSKFRRKATMPFVRQEIPIQVRLTGKISRWGPPTDGKGNNTGDIASVEVEPQASCYHTRTMWISADKLMWGGGTQLGEWDGEPIQQKELELICHYEADVNATMIALITAAKRISLGMVLSTSEAVVDAVRDLEIPITPTNLIMAIKDAGRLDDLLSTVSAHSITTDLIASGVLAKWVVAGFVKSKE